MWAGRFPGKGSTWVNIWRRAAGGFLGCSTLGRGTSKCKDPGGTRPGVLERENEAGEGRTDNRRQTAGHQGEQCGLPLSPVLLENSDSWKTPLPFCVLGMNGLLQRTTFPKWPEKAHRWPPCVLMTETVRHSKFHKWLAQLASQN